MDVLTLCVVHDYAVPIVSVSPYNTCSYSTICRGTCIESLLNIHTFLERVGIELLKRVEPSIVVLLLTTIGSNHPGTATFNRYTERGGQDTTSKAPKAVSLQHINPTTTTSCIGEVTGTEKVKLTKHSSVEMSR
jgi:hypothetical protein